MQIFAKNRQIFAKIDKFSRKSAYFRKNRHIFAKICKFSQKSASFCKNLQIFAKICKFSQKSANFRKNRQIFANICKFLIFEFSGSRPTSQFKNPKIFEFSHMPPKPNRVNFAHGFVVTSGPGLEFPVSWHILKWQRKKAKSSQDLGFLGLGS